MVYGLIWRRRYNEEILGKGLYLILNIAQRFKFFPIAEPEPCSPLLQGKSFLEI